MRNTYRPISVSSSGRPGIVGTTGSIWSTLISLFFHSTPQVAHLYNPLKTLAALKASPLGGHLNDARRRVQRTNCSRNLFQSSTGFLFFFIGPPNYLLNFFWVFRVIKSSIYLGANPYCLIMRNVCIILEG